MIRPALITVADQCDNPPVCPPGRQRSTSLRAAMVRARRPLRGARAKGRASCARRGDVRRGCPLQVPTQPRESSGLCGDLRQMGRLDNQTSPPALLAESELVPSPIFGVWCPYEKRAFQSGRGTIFSPPPDEPFGASPGNCVPRALPPRPSERSKSRVCAARAKSSPVLPPDEPRPMGLAESDNAGRCPKGAAAGTREHQNHRNRRGGSRKGVGW